MKLYHGSNIVVTQPRIIQSARALDFGSGFYLTSDFEQARKWALLTEKRRESGSAVVCAYEFAECFEKLSVLKFKNADAEWLKFVCANRNDRDLKSSYDVVIGPVANDNTMPVINLYLKGSYDEQEALKRLLPQKLKDQYAFKTEKAVNLLKLCEVIEL